MATFIKRGSKWRAEIRRKGHPSQSATFETKRDAKDWADEQERKLRRGGTIASAEQTLSWLIDQYIEDRNPDAYDTDVLEWWREQLGAVRVTELHRDDFTQARKRLMKKKAKTGPNAGELLTPATVNNRMARISAVFTYALEEHSRLVTVHPVRGIRRLETNNTRDPYRDGWGEDSRDALLAACDEFTVKRGGHLPVAEPALGMLVRMALASGARAGELLGLKWRDIDFDNEVAYVYDTKNGDPRPLPMGDCIEELAKWKEERARGQTERERDNDLVLYNTFSGLAYNYRQHWQTVLKKCGLQGLRFHDLRHVAASEWVMDGADSQLVGSALGHRSAAMTKRYSHYATKSIAQLGRRKNSVDAA